jgi:hypothetical protein
LKEVYSCTRFFSFLEKTPSKLLPPSPETPPIQCTLFFTGNLLPEFFGIVEEKCNHNDDSEKVLIRDNNKVRHHNSFQNTEDVFFSNLKFEYIRKFETIWNS